MTSSGMKEYLKRKRRKRLLLVSGFLACLALLLVLGYVFLIRPVFADERPIAEADPAGTEVSEVPEGQPEEHGTCQPGAAGGRNPQL